MKSTIRKAFNITAAFASLFSGMFWHWSALAQNEVMALAPQYSDPVASLTLASAQFNMWAAISAGVAGFALAIASFLEQAD